MSVAPARRVAFEVLRRVEAEGGYASDLLHARLGAKSEALSTAREVKGAAREAKGEAHEVEGEARDLGATREATRDRDAALATELTLGVLRWQRLLDFLLDKHTRKPVGELDLEVRLALRLGIYQLCFLTRVPARAAVDESVELVKRYGKRSAAGLVNAVLRRAADEQEKKKGQTRVLVLPAGMAAAERLGIYWSHPTWMVERWLRQFGEEKTTALLEMNNLVPRLCCSVYDEGRAEEIAAELRKKGMRVEPGRWLRASLTVSGGNPAESQAFREGAISIQDEASQMVALLLDARKGERVLDLCAAPGGKTVVLARQVGTAGHVVAADLHGNRLAGMREQLQRVGAENVSLARLDGTEALPLVGQFERALVDAPCSGTGTLARNPEIRWRLRPEDLSDLHGRQVKLLCNALDQLKPGGRVVYSTCSLEPEENEWVVQEALAGRADVRRVSGEEALRAHLSDTETVKQLFDEKGFFRTFPPEHATDGFFAVVLERD